MNCEGWIQLHDWKAGRPELSTEVSERFAASSQLVWFKNECLGKSEIFRCSFFLFFPIFWSYS